MKGGCKLSRRRKKNRTFTSPPSNNSTPPQELDPEDLRKFSQAVGNNINNNPLWMNELLKQQTTSSYKYKKSDIIKWTENPANSEKQLREVAMYLYNTSSFFKRIVYYLSSICTLDHMIIPYNISESDVKSTVFKKAKTKAYDWLNSFDIKKEFLSIMQVIVLEDIFFGYKRTSNTSTTLQRLPSAWCRLVSKTDIGFQYAFNFMYFLNPLVNIDTFPPEFRKYYDAVKAGDRTDINGSPVNSGSYYWVVLDENAVAFKFDSSTGIITPPLMGIFGDCLEIDTYKDLIKDKLTLDIQKLVYQRIPMGKEKKGEFLISLPDAKEFHNNAKANMPANVGIVTTPMEMASISFDKQAQTKDSLIGLGESNFFKAGGISEVLFSSDGGNIGLNLSVQTDYEFVKHCVRQFEKWINFQLNKLGGKFKFKIIFPDVSVFNRDELYTSALNAASLGYSKRLVACFQGINPQDFDSMMAFENGEDIVSTLLPLASAYTGGLSDTGGNPGKKTKDLTDKGLETKSSGANDNRGK